jgi:hypothetical protein
MRELHIFCEESVHCVALQFPASTTCKVADRAADPSPKHQ